MKTLALGTMLVGMWLVVGVGPVDTLPDPPTHDAGAVFAASAAATPEPTPSPSVSPAALTEVVQRYCVVCHNDALMTGNLSLQTFSVENANERPDAAERMARKLRAGMMPPPGIPRPGGDTLLALVESIEAVVDEAALAAPNLGERRFQRLTRDEYQRVIRDLLDLEVDAGKWLPADLLLSAFDNASAGQGLSTTLLDAYLRAASEVSRLAVGNPEAVSTVARYRNPAEVSQHSWDRVEGAPFGTRGGIVVTHDFPADGEYVFQMETIFGPGTTAFHDIDISVAGEPAALVMIENEAGESNPNRTEPIFIPAGQHQVSVAFVRRMEGPYEDRFRPPQWSAANLGNRGTNYGMTVLPHVSELLITGPGNVSGVSETASRRKVFSCRPSSAAEERPCAESIISGFATQAYRRPLRQGDLADLMNFYDQAAAAEGFEVGVRAGLEAILASPVFLFRLEREPAGARPGQLYRLSDVDLATRLSFFLWASEPDQELLEVAVRGRLSDSKVLEEQVERMMKDPRSETLATRFAHQWLRLQDVGADVWPEPFYYPDFSAQLADGLVRETELFFQHLVQEDRSLLEFFTADYTFVDERLARHYGIEGVSGDKFRRVQYPNDQRRGILGHGSVLLLTSVPDRTSPVIRGKWVMEVLMGTPPPPPPPNVPAFEATPTSGGGRRLTTRERIEAHAAAPVCNSCHRFIDPIGLALDNFDVTGRWRIRENMTPLDTRGTFYDGSPINNPSQLVDVLLKRPIPLVRNFTANLLSYSMGRPVEYFDYPTIRTIARAAKANDYKMSSFVMGIVKSDLFQMRQTQATAN
jgi:hypothetical protein